MTERRMSPFYIGAFVSLGILSLFMSAFLMVAGADSILTVALACCGGSAFAYVRHRTRPGLDDEQ